jgi:hypothetical protein
MSFSSRLRKRHAPRYPARRERQPRLRPQVEEMEDRSLLTVGFPDAISDVSVLVRSGAPALHLCHMTTAQIAPPRAARRPPAHSNTGTPHLPSSGNRSRVEQPCFLGFFSTASVK